MQPEQSLHCPYEETASLAMQNVPSANSYQTAWIWSEFLLDAHVQRWISWSWGLVKLCILGKNFSRKHFKIFFSFFLENRICHFMQIVSIGDNFMETICMKCQILFSRKNKENIISLSSAESAHIKQVNCNFCKLLQTVKSYSTKSYK